ARDIQDTFYLKDHPQLVLRTHCSTVQLRAVLHQKKPPLKYVEIGRSYRHEATDATHEAMFTHCDGIVVDRKLTMAHLVTTLRVFLGRMFPHPKIRIRPGYFPFVEPGIEVDMEWTQNGKTEWLEMLGAGMVHPNVIRAMGFNPREWNGFAFGMGVERQVMIKSGIPDMRFFFNGNLDFFKQFLYQSRRNSCGQVEI
ncbi:MAG: phenylalanine--tRNA ligase subunit alpha, partial [Patescibacteria group bacterium]